MAMTRSSASMTRAEVTIVLRALVDDLAGARERSAA